MVEDRSDERFTEGYEEGWGDGSSSDLWVLENGPNVRRVGSLSGRG